MPMTCSHAQTTGASHIAFSSKHIINHGLYKHHVMLPALQDRSNDLESRDFQLSVML